MDTAKEAAAAAVEQTAKVAEKLETKLTVLWHELPTWQQDNQYIVRGYRPASNSYLKSAQSLSFLHNETVNIYTHLVGAVLALVAGASFYRAIESRYATATTEDITVFACFFGGAAACLGMSAAYHTISNHSVDVASFGNKLDYLGIVTLIWGSFIPTIYYGFQPDPQLIKTFWTMITTLGIGCATVSVVPRFRTPALRPFRAAMFVGMGLFGILPVTYGIKLYGRAELTRSIALNWVLMQGGLYILGAVIYAARVPERLRPGYFDIFGSSHQIFHVLVVLAAAVHLVGLIKAFDYEHNQRDGAIYPPKVLNW